MATQTKFLFGECDCCAAKNRVLHCCVMYGIDTASCADCSGDDPLMIDIDGSGPVPLDAFIQDNEFDADETSEIIKALMNTGSYVGGGGAAPIFTISLS